MLKVKWNILVWNLQKTLRSVVNEFRYWLIFFSNVHKTNDQKKGFGDEKYFQIFFHLKSQTK